MNSFAAILMRELRLGLRKSGGVGMAIGFFLLTVTIVPIGVGPDLNLLGKIAAGVLWVALLLSALLTLEQLFQVDQEDGSLDIMAMSSLPMEILVVAKALGHWITTGLPLVAAAPILGLLLNLDPAAVGPIIAAMFVGSPALSFIGAIGAALTLMLRRGGLLIAIIVLPLYVPIIIFGVSAVNAVLIGPVSFMTPFLILCALSLASIVLGPIAAAAAIRAALN